jgi:hypothetical protein
LLSLLSFGLLGDELLEVRGLERLLECPVDHWPTRTEYSLEWKSEFKESMNAASVILIVSPPGAGSNSCYCNDDSI